ncbi:hypothetical protein TNCV_618061 [Trichonephila clavipes]|nr:hypothetical protein TNCV_618061 [Trichonephila clavipes]
MKPRCLKCGKNHATRNYLIKERQENPFLYKLPGLRSFGMLYQMPQMPQPKKEPVSRPQEKAKSLPLNGLKREFFFANVVSGEVPNQIPMEDKEEDSPSVDSLVKIVIMPLI